MEGPGFYECTAGWDGPPALLIADCVLYILSFSALFFEEAPNWL